MLKKVQEKLQKEACNRDNESKEIVKALDEFIEKAMTTQIRDFTKETNSLFKVNVKFKSKYISKTEYSQMLGLQMFMMENPKYTEVNLRKAIYARPVKYAYIIDCDRTYDDFLEELKLYGATEMAKNIAREKANLENMRKKNQLI